MFKPFPTVKSSLLLEIICALHVEQPWDIDCNEQEILSNKNAILYTNFKNNKDQS